MQNEILYNPQVLGFLAESWVDGFLSPGGREELARVFNGFNIAGKYVMELGS